MCLVIIAFDRIDPKERIRSGRDRSDVIIYLRFEGVSCYPK